MMNAFQAGSCDAITPDKSGLISRKATAEPASFRDDIIIFGLTLSKEPLGPMYRSDDAQWGDIVDWTVYATYMSTLTDSVTVNLKGVSLAVSSSADTLCQEMTLLGKRFSTRSFAPRRRFCTTRSPSGEPSVTHTSTL